MNVLSQLIKARFEQVSSDLTETISGLFWQNTTSKKLKFYDGVEVKEITDTNSTQTLTNKTISGNTAANLKPDGVAVLTLPIATDTLVGRATTDTLTNKSLVDNSLAIVDSLDSTKQIKLDAAGATATSTTITSSQTVNRVLTLPDATDTLVGKATVDTLTNKTLTSPVINTPSSDIVTLSHQATPAVPAAGNVKIYAKAAGNKMYILDSAGVEKPLGSGGGGSSLSWEKIGALSPEDVSQDGIKLEGFDRFEDQEIYLTCNVPADYVAGTQIKLLGAAYFITSVTGNVYFRCQTALIKPGSTVLGTYSNIHTSVNTQTTVPAATNQLMNVGDIDLTSATGTINAVAVAAGDKLRVRLYRNVQAETSIANDKAKLMINNMDIKFSV